MANVKMVEIFNEVDDMVKEYNSLAGGNESGDITAEALKRMSELENEWNEKVKEYSKLSREKDLLHFAQQDNPLFALVEKLTYPTIRVKDEKVEDSDTKVKSLINGFKLHDPKNLAAFCKGRTINGKKVTIPHGWDTPIAQLNARFIVKTRQDMGVPLSKDGDNDRIKEVVRLIQKGETPCSNTALLANLGQAVTALIGEAYKPVSHDINFMKKTFTKKTSRAILDVTAATGNQTRSLVTEICHRLVTNKSYNVTNKDEK